MRGGPGGKDCRDNFTLRVRCMEQGNFPRQVAENTGADHVGGSGKRLAKLGESSFGLGRSIGSGTTEGTGVWESVVSR